MRTFLLSIVAVVIAISVTTYAFRGDIEHLFSQPTAIAAAPAPKAVVDIGTPVASPPVAAKHLRDSRTRFIPDAHCGNVSPDIVLSFDDWGTVSRILEIEKVLLQYHVGAFFFPIAHDAAPYRWVIKKLRRDGFWLGNHTYDHPTNPGLDSLPDATVIREITNGVHSTYLRPPGGQYNQHTAKIAARYGYHICYWTVDTNDWQGLPASTILKSVLQGTPPWGEPVRRGGVVLMHMLYKSNILSVLPQIIKGIRAKHLELCALPTGPTTADIPFPLPCHS